MDFPPRARFTIPLPCGLSLLLGDRPLVMGVINVTPDSFASGALLSPEQAVDIALEMQAHGADLLDLGGESTRPGSRPVTVDEERARVIPAITAVVKRVRIPVSVDTYKAVVAREALAAGAEIVNDISGLQYDAGMGQAVAAAGGALIVMHTRGRSRSMYARANYDNLHAEVVAELELAIERAVDAGVPREAVIVDPGIGFAKRPEHSYGVLAAVSELSMTLGRPVIAGPSRKSFMSDALSGRPALERDWGTAAAVTAAVIGGAHIVRVHAVSQMVQVVRVAEQIRRYAATPGHPDLDTL